MGLGATHRTLAAKFGRWWAALGEQWGVSHDITMCSAITVMSFPWTGPSFFSGFHGKYFTVVHLEYSYLPWDSIALVLLHISKHIIICQTNFKHLESCVLLPSLKYGPTRQSTCIY